MLKDQVLRAAAADRWELVHDVIVGELRSSLQMTPNEDIPLDTSYFDLGITSLLLTDVKQRLEATFECKFDGALLFNSPTVRTLTAHVCEIAFGHAESKMVSASVPVVDMSMREALFSEALCELYNS